MQWRPIILGALVTVLVWWAWEARAHLPGYVGPGSTNEDVKIEIRGCRSTNTSILSPLGWREVFECEEGDMLFMGPASGKVAGDCAIEVRGDAETLWVCPDSNYILKRRHIHI